MESTKGNGFGVSRLTLERLILVSLVALPYLVYGAIATLGSFLIVSLYRWPRQIGRLLYTQGWVWLALALVVGVVLSTAPGESALQVLNFIPFFGFYAAIAVAIPSFSQPLKTLHHWGLALLVATIPINLAAVAEFYLRSPGGLSRWGSAPWLQWLYLQTNYGARASSIFGHPNAFANYMVIVFGLGLGLCAYYLSRPDLRRKSAWICGATALTLVGIFCSGSRNGLLIAGLQVLLFGGLLRPYRYIFWAGLGAIALLVGSALIWGIGGRTLPEAFATATLRLNVWQLALEMIPQRPWFGTGLGTFKLLYDPADFPVAGDFLPHAHNLWIMLAAEAGVPVALGFTGLVGWILGRSTYTLVAAPVPADAMALLGGYLAGFGGTTAFAIFDLAFYDGRINILGWLLLGSIQAIPFLAPGLRSKSA
ncbi:O-antigen ligase family protein [Leptolyngbya sp. KIOST-1]|uniref:O-antigen ligase family protein n=1 Tax=Leptolyngbya sp. KIOST-1 TaxID=1229172 RepID=UPI00055AE869|nr:O-antigen ligase family protein [Leptolyngbya sp. KIOST-1]